MQITQRVNLLLLAFLSVLSSVATAQQPELAPLKREIVEQRLRKAPPSDLARQALMAKMFLKSGCAPDQLRTEKVARRDKNVICVLPGETDREIVVGAHFDHVSKGDGVVDNWSGASLLPSLLEALKRSPRRHTYVFVAFAEEERGLLGSKAFLRKLTPEEKARIEGMVNMDTLGLSPTKVWVTQADPKLVNALSTIANSLKLPWTEMDVDGLGESDSVPFGAAGIPSITIHSVTRQTLSILHTPQDKLSAINLENYYDTYRLISGYLAYLDQALGPRTDTSPVVGANSSP